MTHKLTVYAEDWFQKTVPIGQNWRNYQEQFQRTLKTANIDFTHYEDRHKLVESGSFQFIPESGTGSFRVPDSPAFSVVWDYGSRPAEDQQDKYVHSIGASVSIPPEAEWIVGSRVSFVVRVQVDYKPAIVNRDKVTTAINFASCMLGTQYQTISASHGASRLRYCFYVTGIAKEFVRTLDAFTFDFEWLWEPDVMRGNPLIITVSNVSVSDMLIPYFRVLADADEEDVFDCSWLWDEPHHEVLLDDDFEVI